MSDKIKHKQFKFIEDVFFNSSFARFQEVEIVVWQHAADFVLLALKVSYHTVSVFWNFLYISPRYQVKGTPRDLGGLL